MAEPNIQQIPKGGSGNGINHWDPLTFSLIFQVYLQQTRICLSSAEVEAAFRFFSQDQKKITRDDIKQRMEQFFPNLNVKDYKMLVHGQTATSNSSKDQGFDAVNLEALKQVLNVKDGVSAPFFGVEEVAVANPSGNQVTLNPATSGNGKKKSKKGRYDGTGLVGFDFGEAFQLFEPDAQGNVPDSVFRNVALHCQALANGQTVHYDHSFLLRTFDMDGDGEIGLEDFMKISLKLNAPS